MVAFAVIRSHSFWQVFSEVPPLYSKPKPLPGTPPPNEAVVRPAFQAPLPAAAAAHPPVTVTVTDPRTGQPVVLQGAPANPPPAAAAGGNSNVAKPEDDDLAVDPKMCIVCMERPKEVRVALREIVVLNARL